MWGRNDHQKIQSKGIRITKIVGADFHWKQRNVAGVAGLALLDAVETFWF
jgi:hypothetical protein